MRCDQSHCYAQKRLGPFYKAMPQREFTFLLGGETEITLDSLRSLLADNEVKGFDPVAEAFKVCELGAVRSICIGTVTHSLYRAGVRSHGDWVRGHRGHEAHFCTPRV